MIVGLPHLSYKSREERVFSSLGLVHSCNHILVLEMWEQGKFSLFVHLFFCICNNFKVRLGLAFFLEETKINQGLG